MTVETLDGIEENVHFRLPPELAEPVLSACAPPEHYQPEERLPT